MYCPKCTSKIDGEAILCPRCGVDQDGPAGTERVCDVFLMGLSDPASFDQVLDFLKARTFIPSPDELKARLLNSPTLVTKALEPRRAHRLRESLESLGGIVELRERRMTDRGSAKKVVRDGETESAEPVREPGKQGSRIYLALFLASLAAVGYLGYRQNMTVDGNTVQVAVRKITSQFPGTLGKRKGAAPALPPAEPVAVVEESNLEVATLNNQGVALMNEGRFEDAVKAFEEALLLMPEDPTLLKNLHQGWLQLGYHELKNGNYEKAILALDQATKVLDESPDAFKAMGMAALELGDEARAEEYFREYLGREPSDPAVAKILGELLYKQNKLEEGIRFLKYYSDANPDDLRVKALVDKAGREAVVEEDFEARAGQHFDVRYDGVENMDTGYLVVGLLEDAYQRVGAQLNYYPPERLTTILYSDEDFRAVTQTPDWARGVYDGKIRLPIGGLREKSDLLDRVVAHEYTHAVLHQMSGGRIPTWLNEGLAQYFEGEPNGNHGRNAAYIQRTQDFIPLQDLEGSFLSMDANTASVAYTQSYTVVEQIIENHGTYAIQKLLSEMGAGAEMDEALIAAVGLDYSGLEEEWLKYLAKNYP